MSEARPGPAPQRGGTRAAVDRAARPGRPGPAGRRHRGRAGRSGGRGQPEGVRRPGPRPRGRRPGRRGSAGLGPRPHVHAVGPPGRPAADKLLAPTGWNRPTTDRLPTGAEIVRDYLEPLAAALGPVVVTGARVLGVSRAGLDKARTPDRGTRPFVVRVQGVGTGEVTDLTARAVVDASGTWTRRNPLGRSGLPALGEAEAVTAGRVVGALPDVLGADRDQFAGRRTLVVGLGHSAANTLLDLLRLAEEVAGTEVVWAVRRGDVQRLYGGERLDQLPARGRLGADLHAAVEGGRLEHRTGFGVTRL